jgi:hypothetical protein
MKFNAALVSVTLILLITIVSLYYDSRSLFLIPILGFIVFIIGFPIYLLLLNFYQKSWILGAVSGFLAPFLLFFLILLYELTTGQFDCSEAAEDVVPMLMLSAFGGAFGFLVYYLSVDD